MRSCNSTCSFKFWLSHYDFYVHLGKHTYYIYYMIHLICGRYYVLILLHFVWVMFHCLRLLDVIVLVLVIFKFLIEKLSFWVVAFSDGVNVLLMSKLLIRFISCPGEILFLIINYWCVMEHAFLNYMEHAFEM